MAPINEIQYFARCYKLSEYLIILISFKFNMLILFNSKILKIQNLNYVKVTNLNFADRNIYLKQNNFKVKV